MWAHVKSKNKKKVYHLNPSFTILNKKETSQAYLKYVFSGYECCFAIFILCLNLERSSLPSKMNTMTEASKFLMSRDQFDIRKGPFENAI